MKPAPRLLCLLTSMPFVLGACATPGWRAIVVHRTAATIERIRTGHPDPTDPNLQAVSVDQVGEVALMHFDGETTRSEVLYVNGTELTGLVIGDVDPSIPGEEIYVGGYLAGDKASEHGGAVFQIAVTADPAQRARVRRIWAGDAYVHSVEIIEPQRPGARARILASTYAGTLHALEQAAGGEWSDTVLHVEQPDADPERNKIKDLGFLAESAGPRHVALVAFKTGRLLRIDLADAEAATYLLDEPGGLSRVTPDPDGGAYVTGYAGRLLHFNRTGDDFTYEVLDQEGTDSGLRGAVLGTFPAAGEVANLVVFGFHKRCRALVPRLGVLDPVTLHVDLDRGHTIEAADLVPGNDADELLLGGYSRRVTLLRR
ncbi:MAG: hypothetical protein KDC98_24155 [Planctomycetes bacterium]|nr:hypothetical protein [Planctomycetota bacterium]